MSTIICDDCYVLKYQMNFELELIAEIMNENITEADILPLKVAKSYYKTCVDYRKGNYVHLTVTFFCTFSLIFLPEVDANDILQSLLRWVRNITFGRRSLEEGLGLLHQHAIDSLMEIKFTLVNANLTAVEVHLVIFLFV